MKLEDLRPIDFVYWAMPEDARLTLAGGIRGEGFYKRSCARLRQHVREARAVSFDADASGHLARLSLDPAEVVLKRVHGARLPWKRMLVELDRKAFLKVTTEGLVKVDEQTSPSVLLFNALDEERTRISVTSLVPVPDPDPKTGDSPGLLIEPVGCTIQLGGLSVPEPGGPVRDAVAEICQRFLEGVYDDAEARALLDDMSPAMRDSLLDRDPTHLWSMGRHFMHGQWMRLASETTTGPELLEFIRQTDRLAATMTPSDTPYSRIELMPEPKRTRMLQNYIAEVIGFPRLALAVLTAISNHTITVIANERPKGARLIKGKRRPMPSIAEMRIDLTKDHLYVGERHGPGYGAPKRKHEVRGHWRRFLRDGTPGCPHDWQPTEDEDGYLDVNRQQCSRCAARRTFIKEHERGRGEKVRKPVLVTA